jgi:hypothetical protein
VSDGRIKWYAAGGGLKWMGPFPSQVRAWEALRLTVAEAKKQRAVHPKDSRVWPERVAT